MTEAPVPGVPPLDGLRVVDLSTGIAGAYATKVLCDAGADVVKVEDPAGDPLRSHSSSGSVPPGEDGATFRYLSGSKRSVVAEVTEPSGLDDVRALLDGAEVVVWSPGSEVTEALPVDAVRALAPAAVVLALTDFGLDGPWAGRAGNEFTTAAWSGCTALRGNADRAPIVVGGRLGDWFQGAVAAIGVLGARERALRTGQGELVDVAGLETAALMATMAPVTYNRLAGRPMKPSRSLNLPDIHPTSDGYVGFMVVTGQQWLDFCAMIGRDDWLEDPSLGLFVNRMQRAAELLGVIEDWTRARTTREITELADALRVPASPVVRGDTAAATDHFVASGFLVDNPHGFQQPFSPFRFSSSAEMRAPRPAPDLGADTATWLTEPRVPTSPPAAARSAALPLEGVRVADFTAFWAGPVAGQWLAMLGADVIHVESAKRPDGIRFNTCRPMTEPNWQEFAPFFHGTNSNKRAITLDMGTERGRELARALVAVSDVAMENYSPRVMEQWGLDWEQLQAIRRDLIIVRMPAYGLSGPWRDRGGYAQTIEMAAGLAHRTGYPDRPPVIPNGPCDPIAGTHAAIGALVALEHRRRTGEGSLVEVPMIGGGLALAGELIVEHSAYGATLERTANRSTTHAPQGLYPGSASETWTALSVETDAQWRALVAALGSPAWAQEQRFATVAGRLRAHDDLDAHLTAWFADRTTADAVEELWTAGVPVAQTLLPHDQDTVEQLNARGVFVTLEHPVAGPVTYYELPMRLGNGPFPLTTRPAPTLGQHNRDVLVDLLGLPESELPELLEQGVIGTKVGGGGHAW
jgi:crotonobetainyl-CoA:carnitine CoA-transferase CaiB-like acyl-CoA transferase